MESLESVTFPTFRAPTPSGNLNLLIDDLSFSVSRQQATSAFSFSQFRALHIIRNQKVNIILFMLQTEKFLKCDLLRGTGFN